jgi:predicted SAM-dependent methyltransferase
MNMIAQFERLEQRTPDGVRSAVWGGLTLPHHLVRHKVIADYLVSHRVTKLQIGCGGNILRGWLNSDRNPVRSMGVYFANQRESHPSKRILLHPLRDIIFVDATRQLPFRNIVIDYVFSEHMIEHIGYQEALGLLREIFRVLKPGGKVRIATPDLRFLIDLYSTDKTELQRRYLAWAMEEFLAGMALAPDPSDTDTFIINNFVRNWGHQFIYDQKTLRNALQSCGFRDVTRCEPGESNDENLRCLESHGRRITDDFNRLESIVVEASKPR